MDRKLSCKICGKKFKFRFAKEFHLDVVHNIQMYMCNVCDHSEDTHYTYSYLELLDHNYKFHNSSDPYIVLSYLNIY